MGIPHYLAMTAAELSHNPPYEKTAWMSCHFSPYHSGLSNLPPSLPPDSLLILDDSTPIDQHDPGRIAQELLSCIQACSCRGVLLDFQRSGYAQIPALAAYLQQALPCPVAVSSLYATTADCPVFLPPVPLHSALDTYLLPWKGRDIWLETALEKQVLTLREGGCTCSPAAKIPQAGFAEPALHCHYSIETGADYARFTLWRTKQDLDDLLTLAKPLGITLAVGLWQELHG